MAGLTQRTDSYSHSYLHQGQFTVVSCPNLNAFALWDESREPRGNTHTHRACTLHKEHLQYASRLKHRPFLLRNALLHRLVPNDTHCVYKRYSFDTLTTS